MLRYLYINNIRLFDNGKAAFPLPDLTVFSGTNSCGKSTILKTLLLLRQSQGLYESYGTRPGTLRFTGAQVDLGNYLSLVSYNDIRKNIEILLEIQAFLPLYAAKELLDLSNLGKIYGKTRQIDYKLKCSFVFTASKSITETDETEEITTTSPDGILENSKWELSVDDVILSSWEIRAVKSGNNTRTTYQIIIPIDKIPRALRDLWGLGKSHQKNTTSVDIDLDGLVPSRGIRVGTTKDTKRSVTFRDLPSYITYSMQSFVRTLRRIHYIAPLRAPAKRYYLTNFDITADLDPTGEFLPYFLGGIIEEPRVLHVPPRLVTPIRQSLSEALNGWLYYLRTGMRYFSPRKGEFEASAHKSALVEIGLKGIKGISFHSLADSGFGYSQILPILVRGLMAPKGSTVIIEQPELHLNPALQVRLADFFISMIHAGKQVIVETHSEHIVNAIRVRTANDVTGNLSSNTKIYFIDILRNRPSIHSLDIKEDGTIPQWPHNFFGEAANLAGELLRTRKKIRERNSKQ